MYQLRKLIVLSLFVFTLLSFANKFSLAAELNIQQMIDLAEPGSEISVPKGIYQEAITITKPLTIIADDVILRNKQNEVAVHIKTNQVLLQGITIIHENENPTSAAILIEGNENIVQSATIRSLGKGISLQSANKNIIENVKVERDYPIDLATTNMGSRTGNGIDLFQSHENVLRNNTLTNLLDGIYLESSNGNIVEFNNIKNSRYGFHFMFTEDTILANNSATHNITGAMIMADKRATILNNNFSKQSFHVHSQGLLLYDVQQATIKENVFSENLIGLYMEKSSQNNVFENKVLANFIGLQLKSTEKTNFYHNDFLTNVIQARVTDSPDNIVSENYWDTHQGLDFTGDKKSEIKFKTDPIFLSLVENKPPFQILSQSPGLMFLDLLLDKNDFVILHDTAPLMKAYGNELAFMQNEKENNIFIYLFLMIISITIMFGGIKR